jgi:hypothetical protein
LGENEGIELRSILIPQRFLEGGKSQFQASRKNYNHGALIHVDQPRTQGDALNYPEIPLIARMRAFEGAFRNKHEEDLRYLGISWRPIQGNDKVPRIVPFDAVIEGVKLYNYAVQFVGGIPVNDKYLNARSVEREGGQVLCEVPSRTEKKSRYGVILKHVPIVDVKEKRAIIWSLSSQYEEGREPERTTFLHNLRYEWGDTNRSSDIFVFGPHEVAAYLALVRKYWKGLNNTVPLEMNPFPLPSKKWAMFGNKLENNVMIYDPTLKSKDKLRNLHLDEKCILLGRGISTHGSYNTAYWDEGRDGPIKSYWKA